MDTDGPQSLIERISTKDEEALKELIESYAPKMHFVARRILGDIATNEDIEEILSDSFLRVWETASNYDPNRSSVATWMGYIVAYQGLTHRRKIIQARQLSQKLLDFANQYEQEETPDIVFQMNLRERLSLVLAQLAKMPTKDSQIIISRYLEHKSSASIARELGISSNAVRVRLHRALQNIRATMQDANTSSEGDFHP